MFRAADMHAFLRALAHLRHFTARKKRSGPEAQS